MNLGTHKQVNHESDADEPHDGADFPCLAGQGFHERVADETESEAVGDGRGHGHHDDRQEGGQAVGEVGEVYLAYFRHHQGTDED